MTNILAEIYQHKLIEVRNSKKKMHLDKICQKIKCSQNQQPQRFEAAIKNKIATTKNNIALICEVKKASPSQGIIRQNFNAIEIAKAYEASGAACLSVLTDEKYFMGHNNYLQQVHQNSSLPILRKDFFVDIYQIYEAKMLGASCILLIVAMLDDSKLEELENCAISLDLSVLIEVHNEAELQRALKLKSKLIGINNRNLKTLEVDLQTSQNLAPLVPEGYIIVGESGIQNSNHIKLLQKVKINTFLIGEHFMRQASIEEAVRDILS